MKKVLLAATALAFAAGIAQAQETVKMGTEGKYPPYNFINDKGEIDGFERELGDKLCEMQNLTCTWSVNEWDSIIPNLLSSNYDTIMAGMSITDERRATIDFSDAYYPAAYSAYLALDEGADTTGIVAAQVGTIQADHVAQTGATLLEFPTLDDTIAAVKNGEADAVFADKDALIPFSTDEGGQLIWVAEDVQLGEGIGVGLRKSSTELKGKLNEGIAQMKADGSLNELLKKWFGNEAPQF